MHTCMGFQNKLATASDCQELPEFYGLLDNMLPVTLVKTYYFLALKHRLLQSLTPTSKHFETPACTCAVDM